MYFLLVEIIQPINCVLVSEDVPSISIVLSERRSNALKGTISNEQNIRGSFYTHKPTQIKPSSWSFENTNIKFTGSELKSISNKVVNGVKIKSQDTSPSYNFGEGGNWYNLL